MRKIILIIFLFALTLPLIAQIRKSVLPYAMVSGKMIVEVKVNGVVKKAIFDTGAAKNMITKNMMNELGLRASSTQVITDINSKKLEYKKSTIDKLSLGSENIIFSNYEVLILDASSFECFGIELLLGSEMFAKTIVEIDGKSKTITITSSEIPVKTSLRYSRQFVEDDYMPIVDVDLNGIGVSTLFDTGFGSLFCLKKDDYNKYAPQLNIIGESITEGSIGVGGMSAASMSYRVLVEVMNVNSMKFRDAVVETKSSPHSLMGTKLLDYGKIIIDYARRRLYFEPYEKEVTLPRPVNDYDLTVKDGKLLVCNVWSSDTNNIKAGDVVTHINGKPVPVFDFCKSIVVGIPELKVKCRSILTVETQKGTKKIKYLNKK